MYEQSISLFKVIEFTGIIVAIIGGIVSISRQAKKEREKYATKEGVKQEMNTVDLRLKSIEKDIIDNENQNIREHDSIKAEFLRLIKSVDDKLEILLKRK